MAQQTSTIADKAVATAAASTVSTRLAQYGLAATDAFNGSIVVPEGKTLTLSAPPSGQKVNGYAKLTPKSIDDVKRWIGVPDNVGARRTFAPVAVSHLAMVDSPAALKALPALQRQGVRTLAYQYVYGNSATMAHLSPTFSHLVASGYINGLFVLQDIEVLPKAVLNIAKNLKVLFANNIRIWKGGTIKVDGDLKMDCASMTGNYTNPRLTIVNEVALNLGVLANIGG
jgi:hypothetical protein